MTPDIVERWRGRRVLVVGDVMLDRFIYGRVDRVSPEGPIPVLHYQTERLMPGGAANVARNIVSLGGQALLVGVVGNDEPGGRLAKEIADLAGIQAAFIRTNEIPTIVKTRFVAGGQQIMRLDVEEHLRADEDLVGDLLSRIRPLADSCDAFVLSDYAKGLLTPGLVREVISMGRARRIPIVVDPKTQDLKRYEGATVITPNASEAAALCGEACGDDEGAARAASAIRQRAGTDAVVLTRGPLGMTVDTGEGSTHIRTAASEVYDVSGAGDTVVATLALALAGGIGMVESARLANFAAGVAVGKRGTSAVRGDELSLAVTRHGKVDSNLKVVSRDEAEAIVARWRELGYRVGFTNGCFDLIHPGHVRLLRLARAECDRLVVAINDDASVRRLKGDGRPVQSLEARLAVMAAIESVDLVLSFSEDTPYAMIDHLRPDILLKGTDYTVDTVVGGGLVEARGGKIVLVPLVEGQSTTRLVSRFQRGAA